MLKVKESIPSLIPSGSKFELTTDEGLCIIDVSVPFNILLKVKPSVLSGRPISSLFQVNPYTFPSRESLSSISSPVYYTLGLLLPKRETVASLWRVLPERNSLKGIHFRWSCCFINQKTVGPLSNGDEFTLLPHTYFGPKSNGLHDTLIDSSVALLSAHDLKNSIHSTSIFFLADTKGFISYSSAGISEILGYSTDSVTGSSIYRYVESADISKLEAAIDNSPKDETLISWLNIRIINSKKDWVWMDVSCKRVCNGAAGEDIILLFNRIPDKAVSRPIVREFSKTINEIVNSITDGFAAVDDNMIVRLWNHVAEKLTGVSRKEIAGKNLIERFPTIVTADFYKHLERALKEKVTINVEQYITFLDLWFDMTLYPHDYGMFIYFKDITVRKNQEMLLRVEKNVLEINAKPAATLKGTVDILLDEIHNIYINTFCAVVLFQEKDDTVWYLSGAGVAESFIKSFDGKKCVSDLGPCAVAMSEKKLVIENNLTVNPIAGFDGLPAPQIKSCWSFPIINARDEVLGSFSCYHTKPLEPTEKHLNLFQRIADFLCIIIENRKAEEKVRISNDRYLLATRATSQAIWDWDVKESRIFLGEGFFNMFEFDPSENIIAFDTWKQRIHSTERDKVIKSLMAFISKKDTGLWSSEYRFKKAGGTYAIVVNKGYLTFDSNGDTIRMIGSIEDVTEKKNFENNLIKEEIEKQRLVAQAIVDAQESERAKIGKELHDNVNQVLSTAKLFLEVAKTNAKERVNLIGKSAVQIHHAINEIRHISQSLVPPSISDIGLAESIKDLVQNIAVTKALKVEYNNIGDIEKNISENQKVMIFRIIQEQVNNVLKHAEATRISIQLKVDNKEIELVIADNGKGFDQEKIKTKKGVGLTNIASRVDLFNGKVDIISAPGKGCQLIVKILRTFK